VAKGKHLQLANRLAEDQDAVREKRHRQLLPKAAFSMNLPIGNPHLAHQPLQIDLAIFLAHIAAKRGHGAAAAGGVDAQRSSLSSRSTCSIRRCSRLAVDKWIGGILMELFRFSPAQPPYSRPHNRRQKDDQPVHTQPATARKV